MNEKNEQRTLTPTIREVPVPEDPPAASAFVLPPAAENNKIIEDYLIRERGLDEFTVSTFIKCGMLYEEAEKHNCVFVGYDRQGQGKTAKFAHRRSTKDRMRTDVAGSDKSYSFRVKKIDADILYVFEAPIDLMSYISLYIGKNSYPNCVSLGGVSPQAMDRFLFENKNISEVCLCLDDDDAGNNACRRIAETLKGKYTVTRLVPPAKDWNEALVAYRRDPSFDIKPKERTFSELEPLEIVSFDQIRIKPIEWIWYPFIPKGKYVLMQGDGGIGKTTLAMRIVAALTTGRLLPGMEKANAPINVIVQSAEDGYEDTIKPRLQEAGADMKRISYVKEEFRQISLSDSRVRRAIRKTDAKLLIFDPIQAYLGKGVDMNRANEVRPVLLEVSRIAEETGCTIMPIGHLNKNNAAKINQRTIGSVDIAAAARSVLTVARDKDDQEKRFLCQTKSNLAPEASTLEFYLRKDRGFTWGNFCNVRSDDLFGSRRCADPEPDPEPDLSQKDKAKMLILRILSRTEEMSSNELKQKVMLTGIGYNSYIDARKELDEEGKMLNFKTKDGWMNSINIPCLTAEERKQCGLE